MTAPPADQRLLLVGCGNMGRAILDAWLRSGMAPPGSILVLDPLATDLPAKVRGYADVTDLPSEEPPSVIVLAVKPQQIEQVAAALRRRNIGRDALLLSILAGVPLARLEKLFPRAIAVRFMANLAAAFGLSPVAVSVGELQLLPSDTALVHHVLEPLGPIEWLRNEDELHAVTALAGSGPGFVYRFLAALAQAGAAIGLEPGSASRMALATVQGAAALAERSGEEFAALAARVASKGGTTEAGLAVLDRDDALAELVGRTLRAASERSRELAGEG